MKSLKQYIMEKMSKEEFFDKIHNMYNNDYDKVINKLNNNLFDIKDLCKTYCENKKIDPKIWVELHEYSNIETLLTYLNENDGILDINDVFLQQKENEIKYKNIFELIESKLDNNINLNKKDLREILKNIANFKTGAGNTAKGKFEYLLYFFIKGKRNNNATKGDVIIGNTQIEVKYCKDSNFKRYNGGVLNDSTITEFEKEFSKGKEEFTKNNNVIKLLKAIYKNKKLDEDKEKQIDEQIQSFYKETQKNIDKYKNDIKNYIGVFQLYMYLLNEFNDNIDNIKIENKYLILFDAKNFGNYIYLTPDITSHIEILFNFCEKNIKWGSIHRNAVQFTLN